MTSRKRWERIYTLDNPFRLPQGVMRVLRKCVRSSVQKPETVRYLWIHLSDEGFVPPQVRREQGDRPLGLEDWLNVIDEAASLGAETLIVSLGCPPSEKPEVWTLCEWAQATYDMAVGLYVYGVELTPADLEHLCRLDKNRTRLFVDSQELDRMRFVEERGLNLCLADGLKPGEQHPPCHLPESMTCVCANGTLYTCGLVLGNERFRLGDVARERLDNVMIDESLPHHIPGGYSEEMPRRCNACPPLMERKLRGLSGH